MRWRAQELATRELGPRSELEMERSQSKEIERAGFTASDRMLAGHAAADGRVSAEQLAKAPRQECAACLGRLAVLEKMHLARPEPAGAWRLADDWEPLLRQHETAVEIQARLARHVLASLGQGLVVQPGERFKTVEGVVRGLGLHDELAGTMYAVVERGRRLLHAGQTRGGLAARVGRQREGQQSDRELGKGQRSGRRAIRRRPRRHLRPGRPRTRVVDARRSERGRAAVVRRYGECQRPPARTVGTSRGRGPGLSR